MVVSLPKTTVGVVKAILVGGGTCGLGVFHGNRQKQNKYLVWIAEEVEESRLSTRQHYANRESRAAIEGTS